MTVNDRMGTRVLLSLAILAAMMIVGLFTGMQEAGAVNCPTTSTTDTADSDGFPDTCECSDLALGDGSTQIKGYANKGNLPRSQYMDPNFVDLFVYLQRAADGSGPTGSGSLLTDTNDVLFQPITNLTTAGALGTAPPGLGVALHVYGTNIFRPNTDRSVVSNGSPNTATCQAVTQKGAWIIEDNEASDGTSGSLLGNTPCIGSPNCNNNTSTVYTLRVKNFVDSTCAGYINCIDSGDRYGIKPSAGRNDMQGLYNLYHRQNVNHELAHQVALVPQPAPTKGKTTGPTVTNNHYPSAMTGSMMEYSVFYKQESSTSTVTWYIPANFIQYDVNNRRLK